MTLSSISKDGRYGFGNNFSGLWIVFLDDFFFFFFGRQRKVRNINYRGSPLYLYFRKMEDTDLRISFQDRLYIVDCIFGRFLFFFG